MYLTPLPTKNTLISHQFKNYNLKRSFLGEKKRTLMKSVLHRSLLTLKRFEMKRKKEVRFIKTRLSRFQECKISKWSIDLKVRLIKI